MYGFLKWTWSDKPLLNVANSLRIRVKYRLFVGDSYSLILSSYQYITIISFLPTLHVQFHIYPVYSFFLNI